MNSEGICVGPADICVISSKVHGLKGILAHGLIFYAQATGLVVNKKGVHGLLCFGWTIVGSRIH